MPHYTFLPTPGMTPSELEKEPAAKWYMRKYTHQPISQALLASVEDDLEYLKRMDRMEGKRTQEREEAKSVLYFLLIQIQQTLYPTPR